MTRSLYAGLVKPVLDRSAAFILLIVTLPLLIIIAGLLLVANNGDVFFLQERIGYQQRRFRIVKFRTMSNRRDSSGELLPDNERLTRVGKLIRALSFDELPQLLNVINGDMSLVGPRPLLVDYLPLYSPFQQRRHNVHPGITGWAQVNGRNAIEWKRRLELDVWYSENISFRIDLKIILLTIGKVIRSEGVNAEKGVTMTRFTGNN